jgi:tripartite ATP-independent transporter DctP family solute receptor
MKKRTFSKLQSVLLSFLAIALIFCFPSFGKAAQPIELKLGHTDNDTDVSPYQITAKKFGSLVEKYTNGKYKVNIFPNSQLGFEKEMVKNLTMGSMDLAVITSAVIGPFIGSYMAIDMPFIFPEREVAYAVLDGEVGEVLLSKLSKLHIKGLGFAEVGFRHMLNNVRPIKTPEDTKGIKFRVMQSPIYIGMFQALGSNAIPMPWGEVFTAVQQKVIDGVEMPLPILYGNKFYEIVKYLSLTSHTYTCVVLLCSENRWKELSANEKEVFKRAARETILYERGVVRKIQENSLEKIKASGMIVNDVPDKKPFQEAVKPLYKKFEDEIGKDILDSFIKARDTHH